MAMCCVDVVKKAAINWGLHRKVIWRPSRSLKASPCCSRAT